MSNRIEGPKEIYDYLDRYVVAQDDAKKVISNALFLHTVRAFMGQVDKKHVGLKKTNVLLMGDTGSGKTYIASKAAKLTRLPFFKINAKELTNTGYVGTSIEKFMERFYYEAGGHQSASLFEHSIIFIDEIDKICLPMSNRDGDFNQAIQQCLLTVLEGTEYRLGKSKIKTDRMLFILAGNFSHLRKNRLLATKKNIGFVDNLSKEKASHHQELVKAGMVPELAGRISMVSELSPLTAKELKIAFMEAEDCIYSQYQELFKFVGKDLKLSTQKINKIVKECLKNKTGTRGLQSALDRAVRDDVFNLEGSKFEIPNVVNIRTRRRL